MTKHELDLFEAIARDWLAYAQKYGDGLKYDRGLLIEINRTLRKYDRTLLDGSRLRPLPKSYFDKAFRSFAKAKKAGRPDS